MGKNKERKQNINLIRKFGFDVFGNWPSTDDFPEKATNENFHLMLKLKMSTSPESGPGKY